MRVSDYTENAVGAIQAGPAAAAPPEPMAPPDHNTGEAVAVARLLFRVVNLEAMRQMEGLEKVQGEWSLICTGHNLLKLFRRCRLSSTPTPPSSLTM